MRRFLLACSILLLAATGASAGTLNLRWNVCWGDGGVPNRAFACNTNAGSNVLVGSFFVPHDVHGPSGNEIVVDIATAGATLSPWWEFFNTGACRRSAMSINFAVSPAALQCTDWADGQAVGAIASYSTPYGPNSARIRAASAVPPLLIEYLFAGVEYFAFNLVIANQKTVGTGSCSGCSLGACIDLKSLRVTTSDPRDAVQLIPGGVLLGFFDALATWQGGVGVISARGDCPAATPTRDCTWGEVKALYR